jgi:hypothetical protein
LLPRCQIRVGRGGDDQHGREAAIQHRKPTRLTAGGVLRMRMISTRINRVLHGLSETHLQLMPIP